MARPSGHPDGVRFDVRVQPCMDPFGKRSEFFLAGSKSVDFGAAAMHRGAIAEKRVGLSVKTGDRIGSE
jgi:hypothetical protein